jgi:hypothetical protein
VRGSEGGDVFEDVNIHTCTTGENIPGSLFLPGSSQLAMVEAIGMLEAYAFATKQQ